MLQKTFSSAGARIGIQDPVKCDVKSVVVDEIKFRLADEKDTPGMVEFNQFMALKYWPRENYKRRPCGFS